MLQDEVDRVKEEKQDLLVHASHYGMYISIMQNMQYVIATSCYNHAVIYYVNCRMRVDFCAFINLTFAR